jgi:hypothetical protein
MVRVLLIVIFVSGLTACGSDPANDSASSQTLAEQALIEKPEWDAVEENVMRCMKQEGFKYFPVPFVQPSDVEKYLTIPMSLNEMKRRRSLGYGVAERQRLIIETQSEMGNNPYIQSLSAADQVRYSEALSGDRRSGKAGKCMFLLSASGIIRLERPSKVAQEAKKRFTSNEVVRSLGLEWQTCMSNEGFANFGMPWEITLGEIVDVMGAGYEQAFSDELAIARADVDCLTPLFDELHRLREKAELEADEAIPA